jgi:hypothetical protein
MSIQPNFFFLTNSKTYKAQLHDMKGDVAGQRSMYKDIIAGQKGQCIRI